MYCNHGPGIWLSVETPGVTKTLLWECMGVAWRTVAGLARRRRGLVWLVR